MARLLIFLLFCICVTLIIWFLIGKINAALIRIFLRSGLLAIVFTPSYHIKDHHISFFPAWARILQTITIKDMDYFLGGLIPIIVVWIAVYLVGILIFFTKKQQSK